MEHIKAKDLDRIISRTVLVAALLSLGAPLGYLALGFLIDNHNQLSATDWFYSVWSRETWLLLYLTVPTLIVFTLFGLITGRQKYQLALQTRQMDEFLHVAAHDIRGPLSIIQGAASILSEQLAPTLQKDQVELFQMVERQSGIIIELLTELLDISKMEEGGVRLQRQRIDPISLVSKAASEVELLLREKSGSIEIRAGLPTGHLILADAFRVRQVLRNILNNAIKFMSPNTDIVVDLSETRSGETQITIANQGPKIPEEKLAGIFDKYAQARVRDQRLGYGLGLAICKNIMDIHRGSIRAENVDNGVCIRIIFPKNSF